MGWLGMAWDGMAHYSPNAKRKRSRIITVSNVSNYNNPAVMNSWLHSLLELASQQPSNAFHSMDSVRQMRQVLQILTTGCLLLLLSLRSLRFSQSRDFSQPRPRMTRSVCLDFPLGIDITGNWGDWDADLEPGVDYQVVSLARPIAAGPPVRGHALTTDEPANCPGRPGGRRQGARSFDAVGG